MKWVQPTLDGMLSNLDVGADMDIGGDMGTQTLADDGFGDLNPAPQRMQMPTPAVVQQPPAAQQPDLSVQAAQQPVQQHPVPAAQQPPARGAANTADSQGHEQEAQYR